VGPRVVARGATRIWLYWTLAAISVTAFALELCLGAMPLSPGRVWAGILGDDALARQLVVELRLPRAVLAVLTGASLAAAASMLQGATGNPLADPHLMGVSGGALLASAAMAVAALDLGPAVAMALGTVGALLGAAPPTVLAGRGIVSGAGVALIGVGLSYLWAVLVLAILTSAGFLFAPSLAFLGGSLAGRGWDEAAVLAMYLAAALAAVPFLVRPLDALALGDEVARSLGFSPALTRGAAVAAAALLVGPATWVAGAVPLLGLACAQGARRLWRHSYASLVPGSALLGAILVLAADVLSRSVLPGAEMPLGTVTASVGLPVLAWVAWRATWRTTPYS
jgi:iron complex transport system permease protein